MVNNWLYCSLDRNCSPGTSQLGAHEQRHQPADEEEDEAGDAVHDSDQLVIGGGGQLVEQVARWAGSRRKRPADINFFARRNDGSQVSSKFRSAPENVLQS